MSQHPFNASPSDDKILKAIEESKEVYSNIPETKCKHRGECCQAGCPNMYYVEYLSILTNIVEKLSEKEKKDLLVTCIRKYLKKSDEPSSCMFLTDKKMCSVYEYRHLKCRLYGLIPESLYNLLANSVAQEMKCERKDIPLCTQCPNVIVKDEFKNKFPGNKVSETSIKKMEKKMKELDRFLGIPRKIQQEQFGFLTFHDWHLLFSFGELWMETLSKLRISLTDEKKEQFIESLKISLTEVEPRTPNRL